MTDNQKKLDTGVTVASDSGLPITTVVSPDGTVNIVSEDKLFVQQDKNILSIGVQNLIDLESISMSKINDRTMIVGIFKDGGSFDIAYTDSGRLELMSCRDTSVNVNTNDPDGIRYLICPKIAG